MTIVEITAWYCIQSPLIAIFTPPILTKKFDASETQRPLSHLSLGRDFFFLGSLPLLDRFPPPSLLSWSRSIRAILFWCSSLTLGCLVSGSLSLRLCMRVWIDVISLMASPYRSFFFDKYLCDFGIFYISLQFSIFYQSTPFCFRWRNRADQCWQHQSFSRVTTDVESWLKMIIIPLAFPYCPYAHNAASQLKKKKHDNASNSANHLTNDQTSRWSHQSISHFFFTSRSTIVVRSPLSPGAFGLKCWLHCVNQ